MKKIYLTIGVLFSLALVWCQSNIDLKENGDTTTNITTNENWDWGNDTIIEKKSNDNLNNTRIYENKTNNFSFEFDSWRTFQEDKYWFTTIVFAPVDDGIKENVWIAVQNLQKTLSIQEYAQETINKLKETVKWFQEIKNEDISINWLNWKTIIYEYQEWEVNIKAQQTFLITENNTVYIINYTATSKTFDKFINWVETILNSFTLN